MQQDDNPPLPFKALFQEARAEVLRLEAQLDQLSLSSSEKDMQLAKLLQGRSTIWVCGPGREEASSCLLPSGSDFSLLSPLSIDTKYFTAHALVNCAAELSF
jgi:hypothetical protein